MHTSFKILLDKEDTLNFPNFEPEHIDYFLNEEGQDVLVKQRYSGRVDAKSQALEETQKRTDDLRVLITDVTILPEAVNVANKPNALFFTLPTDYWFAINEEANISYEDCSGASTTSRINVKPITHDKYTKVIRDPFKGPSKKELLRLMYQNSAELIFPTGVTITNYKLRYIRKPQRISLSLDVDCELPDYLHQEVVKTAVASAIRTTQSSAEYQKILNELNKQE